VRVASKSSAAVAVHPASALDCAQLRFPKHRWNPFRISVRTRQESGQKNLAAEARRHEKPARTQSLTSAAYSLCPHPNSFAPLSPIPKLASAARPPTTRHTSTDTQPIPLTQRHLNLARCPLPMGLALPRPAFACVPTLKFTRRAAQTRLIP